MTLEAGIPARSESGKLTCRKKALSFLKVPDAIVLFKHLNLPAYLLPFLGTAKLLGCLTLLLPKYPRLKEWVYAGLTFDLTGATFCALASGDSPLTVAPMPIGFALIAGSYIYFLKRRTQPGEVAGKAINPGLAA
ncbi:MAG TPA: DoxX family protein [Puia sp.]|nr:DoxX family protein [Puia sp.]